MPLWRSASSAAQGSKSIATNDSIPWHCNRRHHAPQRWMTLSLQTILHVGRPVPQILAKKAKRCTPLRVRCRAIRRRPSTRWSMRR